METKRPQRGCRKVGASETSSKGWKLACASNPGLNPRASETSSKGWKHALAYVEQMAVALPKLPLRDGNTISGFHRKHRSSTSETSSKGWKHGDNANAVVSRLPSETSSKGWELFIYIMRVYLL